MDFIITVLVCSLGILLGFAIGWTIEGVLEIIFKKKKYVVISDLSDLVKELSGIFEDIDKRLNALESFNKKNKEK